MYGQVVQKVVLNMHAVGQKLECTYQSNDILLFRTWLNIHLHTRVFKIVQQKNKGFGTELLELNAVISLCNYHTYRTIQQNEKSGV